MLKFNLFLFCSLPHLFDRLLFLHAAFLSQSSVFFFRKARFPALINKKRAIQAPEAPQFYLIRLEIVSGWGIGIAPQQRRKTNRDYSLGGLSTRKTRRLAPAAVQRLEVSWFSSTIPLGIFTSAMKTLRFLPHPIDQATRNARERAVVASGITESEGANTNSTEIWLLHAPNTVPGLQHSEATETTNPCACQTTAEEISIRK